MIVLYMSKYKTRSSHNKVQIKLRERMKTELLDLPPPIITDILSRLNDSSDLARTKLTSKTLNKLSKHVTSLNITCTLSRYLKSRAPVNTTIPSTPFKSIVLSLVSESPNVDTVFIGVDKSLAGVSYDDIEDEEDDLHLTDVAFLKDALLGTGLCHRLTELSVSDFWIQSCWRRSAVLDLVSGSCNVLRKLELKNAWLSVDGLKLMPNLTSLTLEFIRLDDEDLKKVNESFPCLEVLNLIGVGGLKVPRIDLLHLKSCKWTVSNAPLSLTITAPKLVKLVLRCIKPYSLVLGCPLLNDFSLSLENTDSFEIGEVLNLENLRIQSPNLKFVVGVFPVRKNIKSLVVDSVNRGDWEEKTKCSFETLFDVFPNISFLKLGPGAWSELKSCFLHGGLDGRKGMDGLKEIVAHVVVERDLDETLLFIFTILKLCTSLSDVALLIDCDLVSSSAKKLISECTAKCPRVRWKWGMWKEGTKDSWASDSI